MSEREQPRSRTFSDGPGDEPPGAEGELPRGATLGRYVVLERLGQGGMGAVYAAWDFALERRVALKLIRGGGSAAGQQRLLHEAQAMARVTHPGINAIYDVGLFHAVPFIAMELVEGGSVSQWLKAAPRGSAQVLDVFLQAGRGLAAAHAAGITHGDFKPHNVLLGEDGRARVTDFGLAAGLGDGADAPGQVNGGTPAYLAPERLEGAPPSASSDQFSFCVALYEALFGRRPFDAAPLGKPPVPSLRLRWLRPVLARGLAREPSERYPDMGALVQALSRGAHPGRRYLLAAVVAGAALAVAGYARGRASDAGRCGGAPEAVAALWSPARQATLEAAFTKGNAAYGPDVWRAVRAEVDGWAGRWQRAFVSACEATRVRAVQSEPVLDLRMRCLTAQLKDVDALLTALAEAPGAAGSVNGISAAQGLRGFGACEDGPHLRQWRPHRAERQGSQEALRARLGQGKALRAAGGHKAAQEVFAEVVSAARAVGDEYVLGDALAQLGMVQLRTGAGTEAARATLEEAVLVSERTGAEEAGVEARLGLSHVERYAQRPQEIPRQLAHARALLARLGSAPSLEAKVRFEAAVEKMDVDYEETVVRLEDAVAFMDRALPPDDLIALNARMYLGAAYAVAGSYEQGAQVLEVAVRRYAELMGKSHPAQGKGLASLSETLRELGRVDEALAAATRARELAVAYAPAENAYAISTRLILGNALATAGRAEQAEAELKGAIASEVKVLGREGQQSAVARMLLGTALRARGSYAQARESLARALAYYEREAPQQPDRVSALVSMGELELELGRPSAALSRVREAEALCEKLACGAQVRGQLLTTRAEAQAAAGELANARASAEAALALYASRKDQGSVYVARTRFALARALPAEERGRALELARQAEPVLAARKDLRTTCKALQGFVAANTAR